MVRTLQVNMHRTLMIIHVPGHYMEQQSWRMRVGNELPGALTIPCDIKITRAHLLHKEDTEACWRRGMSQNVCVSDVSMHICVFTYLRIRYLRENIYVY
ncbi:hypothetical protein CEXT_263991 [Caerostris extrusa]|uniref:FHA domain-containing protein n=1 Tax=Caerostris extrusa TaxID=172846 RepID=A0AAV4M7P8_CAEEX|nr:hypothetical protein CEXT_263991 [Caerostris extrusa]